MRLADALVIIVIINKFSNSDARAISKSKLQVVVVANALCYIG